MNGRGGWQGMLTIARLNWPFYGVAVCVFVAAICGAVAIQRADARVVCAAAALGSFYFLFVSLGVSHLIYDRSDLYRWSWLDRALANSAARSFVFCHSGFDEASVSLRERLGDVEWVVLDHYDEARMTEASIRRARALYPPTSGTLPARFDRWPVDSGAVDVVFGLLAIHELRSEEERQAWFLEAKRCLRKSGRVILVEHTRDFANFLAFGPGFVHFHSPASWRRCFERAGFGSLDEFCVTPWVRVFVIGMP